MASGIYRTWKTDEGARINGQLDELSRDFNEESIPRTGAVYRELNADG